MRITSYLVQNANAWWSRLRRTEGLDHFVDELGTAVPAQHFKGSRRTPSRAGVDLQEIVSVVIWCMNST